MRDLADIRKDLDVIDRDMAKLFERRLDLVTQVAEYKIANGKPVFDKKREEEKLKSLSGLVEDDFSKKGLQELFEQIMAISRKRQYQLLAEHARRSKSRALRIEEPGKENGFVVEESIDFSHAKVVYQGVEGAYSQMAMNAFFGEDTDSFHVETWRDAMEAIKNGEADFAVLPIENSSAGIVSENYDLLVEYDNYIVGEQTIKVDHALLGLPGADMSDITCVYSHPQALMQCVDFLDEHREWERISLKNTAMSAKKIVEDGRRDQAAIANPLTAEIYGLCVLQSSINYSSENSTRFLIVSGKKMCRRDAAKISICFEIPHESGSLYHMLSHIIYNNLNMNKIESRPIKDKSFEYRFFVDFEGNLADSAVQNALKGLSQEASKLRILGNY